MATFILLCFCHCVQVFDLYSCAACPGGCGMSVVAIYVAVRVTDCQ